MIYITANILHSLRSMYISSSASLQSTTITHDLSNSNLHTAHHLYFDDFFPVDFDEFIT